MDREITAIEAEKEFLASRTISSRINHRSELAQEFISQKGNFAERWAIFFFLGIFLLILAGTWFVKYPDIIASRAVLISINAPKEIIPHQQGKLVRIFVSNNEQVGKNQVLGWIESTADHNEIIALSARIDSSIRCLDAGLPGNAAAIFRAKCMHLGEIQKNYQQFISAWQTFNDYSINGFFAGKKAMLVSDIHASDSMTAAITHQKILTEQDLQLAGETFSMSETLVNEKVLSKEEFRVVKSKYLNKEMAIPQLQATLLSNDLQKREKLKEIAQLNHDILQQEVVFRQALQSLQSAVDDWIKQYVLQSPIDGKVSFIIPIQENQFVQSGKILGYINPEHTQFYVETYLSQNNFGKIDTGLAVQLRFDAYPYQESGYVEGTLNYISTVPSDSNFLATIKLNHGLVTNNRKVLPYKNGLTANAIIITKNMRLLERIYYNMVKSISISNK